MVPDRQAGPAQEATEHMKILHTSDWHIGRQLHGVALIDDQRHVLEQIVAIVAARAIDVVLMCVNALPTTWAH